jgi:outer membrane protein TolC
MHTVWRWRRLATGAMAVSLAVLLGSSRPSAAQSAVTAQSALQPPNKFLGSVPTGERTGTTLELSLKDTFDRALKYNLGLLESDQDVRAARAERLRGLNALLPDLSGQVSATREQINLAASGFNFTFPGVNIPTIVGPFGVADARVYVSQSIFNRSDIKHWRSTAESERASQYANKNDREIVILAAGNAYLAVISDLATVDSTRAQLTTARTLHDRAVDQNKAGVIAGIDVLRARVEQQTQQQRLIAAENQLAIDKLTLARVIGLPKGQEFQVTDAVPYAPLDGITLDQALERAVTTRPDYLDAKSRVRAAELQRQAAVAANYPSLSADADYGDIGSPNFGTSHGTFSVAVTLKVPIFQGTRVRADTLAADSVLHQRRAELADLDGMIDQQVRTAFLNIRSSSDLVTVAQSNIDLANQTLVQAQDRLAAGVANNLDVVQAQESVANANQSYIGSLYTYNLAKITLAQAIGVAEQSALQYLGAK